MNLEMNTLNEVAVQALQLPPLDKVRLVERLMITLEQELAQPNQPLLSWRGLCADLGSAPSAEEIDEARREAWANFPREEIE